MRLGIERDPLRGRRPLPGDHEARHAHTGPVPHLLEVRARQDLLGEIRPHQLHRVLSQRDLRGPVVRQQPLPRRHLPQRRSLADLQRKRQLRPIGNSNSRDGDPELPQSPPAISATERIARPSPGKPPEGIALSTAARREISQ